MIPRTCQRSRTAISRLTRSSSARATRRSRICTAGSPGSGQNPGNGTHRIPPWFEEWIDAERQARVIRWWEPLLIPGLLQTSPTMPARLFLAWQKSEDTDKIERDVAARIDRKRIFQPPDPATLIAVIDEGVLHRKIGDEKTMREQLEYLVETSMHPNISLHVVPAGIGAHTGFWSVRPRGHRGGNTEGCLHGKSRQGLTSGTPSVISKIAGMFERVRSEALPRGQRTT